MRYGTVLILFLVICSGCDTTSEQETDWDLILQDIEYGEYKNAIDKITFFQEKYPGNKVSDSYYQLGICYFSLFRFEEALNYYNKSIAINDKQLEVRCNIITCLDLLGRKEEGDAYIVELLSLYPENIDALITLASHHQQFDEIEKAEKYIDKAYSLDNESLVVLNFRGYLRLNKSQYELAIQDFEEILGIDSTAYLAWNNLGYALFKSGDREMGEHYVQKSLEINPLNSYGYYNLSKIKLAQEDYFNACHYLDQAAANKFGLIYGNAVDSMKRKYCVQYP